MRKTLSQIDNLDNHNYLFNNTKMKGTKKKPGPKPKPPRDPKLFAPLLIRDVPIDLRNKAKSEAAIQQMTFREFAIAALAEKAGVTL